MEELKQTQEVAIAPVIEESVEDRALFIRKTYLHLAMAILLFIIVEAIFLNTPWIVNIGLSMFTGWLWLLMLGGFFLVTSFSENLAMQSTDKVSQYAALLLYVVAEAFLFVPLIYMSIAITGDDSLIKQAGLLTLFLFTGISSVVLISRSDFSILKTVLTVGGVLAIGLIVVGILFQFSLGLWFSFAMVGLATVAILYQTSNILHKYHTEQYVAASLGLFGAFMLMVWYVLNILMSLSGD